METLLGVWESCNVFITEDGIKKKVVPYNYLYDTYKSLWPLRCYINLEDDRSIISVFPVE